MVPTVPFAQTDWPLPIRPQPFFPADLKNAFTQFLGTAVSSGRVFDLAPVAVPFRQADLQGVQFAKVALPSGVVFDVAAQPGPFRQADIPFNSIPLLTPPTPFPFRQSQWDLPVLGPRIVGLDLANATLPPKETFTGFPVRQMDWPLPASPPRNQVPQFALVNYRPPPVVATQWKIFIICE